MLTALMTTLATADVRAQGTATWTSPTDPIEIAEGLYYVGSAGLAAYLVTSDDGHILIDAPLEGNVPLILENIRTLGFDPRDVRIHLVTHAHYDHAGGFAALKEATGGRLLVSAADAPFLREGRDFGLATEGYPPAAIDGTIGHLETVGVGSAEVTAHLTPGHTPGCTSWSGVANIDGEAHRWVLVCSLSVLDVYRLAGDDPTWDGQAEDFCRSVAHLRSLEADIFLANHTQFFDFDNRSEAVRSGSPYAFVDPDGLDAFVDDAERAIGAARRAQGLTPCG